MGDFEKKRYTNPTLMFQALRNAKAKVVSAGRLNATIEMQRSGGAPWPTYGLAKVQWEGPWTEPGVPIRVRYCHTHWVASALDSNGVRFVFDINAMAVGGWIDDSCWGAQLVPWLLERCEPRANGRWHLTNAIEIAA